MGVWYKWADNNPLIMNVYVEFPWTWKEFRTVVESVIPILRDAEHPCATIVNVTKLGSIPRDENLLQILLNVEKNLPDNVFASAIVGAPYTVTLFINILMKLRPRAQRLALFAPTMDEAQAQILALYKEAYSPSSKSA